MNSTLGASVYRITSLKFAIESWIHRSGAQDIKIWLEREKKRKTQ